jgi:hypothetical protein
VTELNIWIIWTALASEVSKEELSMTCLERWTRQFLIKQLLEPAVLNESHLETLTEESEVLFCSDIQDLVRESMLLPVREAVAAGAEISFSFLTTLVPKKRPLLRVNPTLIHLQKALSWIV